MEEHSQLSQEPFPIQYQQCSRGWKSLFQCSRFFLVMCWSWAGKAQPVCGPWLVRAGRDSKRPRGCCSQELGSLSPPHCQCFQQVAGAPTATLAGNLLQSELFPRLGRVPRLRMGFFTAERHGAGSEPFLGERKTLLSCCWPRPCSASLSRNAITALIFPKEWVIRGRRAAPTSELQTQKRGRSHRSTAGFINAVRLW